MDHTGVVRLHALEGWDENTAACQVVGLRLGGDGALDGTAGPEGMGHGAPRVLRVSSVVGSAVLAGSEAGSFAGDLEVDNAIRVDGGLDGVGVALFIEGDGQIVGGEGKHLLVEYDVGERVRVPDVLAVAFKVEDLRVEVSGSMDTPTQFGGWRK